jgi:hypothetical protein
MPHGVYDERGELVLSTESECLAFATAMRRQSNGQLTTVLIGGSAEVLFAPSSPVGARAETALEYQARMNSVVKEEMAKPVALPSPSKINPYL